MRPTIELVNICYTYPNRSKPILHNLNLSISEERIGLIGSNGSGKTTLFQIIMGLIQANSGDVLFQGEPLKSPKDFRGLRQKVGLLFQSSDDQLFSPTVLEDVAFGPLNLGFSPEEAMEIAMSTLKRLGLEGFENRITHKLSGGEKKLVALATILSMKPQLLLLDEPTNNLDPETRERLISILQGLDLAHLIISHDWDFLAETTTQLITIENGHLHACQDGHVHAHRHVHVHTYGNHPHEHKADK